MNKQWLGAVCMGEVVQVFDGATLLGNATVLGTSWSYQTGAQALGSHTYSARVTSQAWNLSSAAQSQTVQVNSLSPVALTVDTGVVAGGVRYVLLKQTGVSTNGLFVNEIQVYANGVNVALGKAVTAGLPGQGGYPASGVTNGSLTRDGNNGYAANADSASNWVMVDLGAVYSIDSLSVYALSGGDLSYLRNVQLFGSVNDISGLTYAQLGTDPNVARLGAIGVTPTYETDMPVSGFENYTLISDTTPNLAGTLGAALGAGEVVKVYVDGVAKGNATVTGTSWSYGLAALAVGSHAYRVQIEGADGSVRLVRGGDFNVSASGAPAAVVTGLTATDDSGIATGYAAGNYTGVLAANSSTDDTTPTLSGTLSQVLGVGEVVRVFDGATLLGAATVSGTGWTFQTAAQAAGAHNYSARVVNLASGAASAAQNVALSVGGLALTSLIADSGPQQGNLLATGGRTSDSTPVLAGTLAAPVAAGERLAIYVDGVFSGNATISGLTWFYTPSAALGVGAHVLNVRLEDIATGSMRMTLAQAVEVVDAATVPTTVVDSVIRFIDNAGGGIYASGNQTGTLAANVSTDDTTPTLSGQISAPLKVGEVVQVLLGGVVLGTATVSGTGWSFTPAALATGSQSFVARVVDTGTGSASAAQSADIVVQTLTGISITPQSGTAQTGGFVRYVLVQQAAVSAAEQFDVGYIRVNRNGVALSEQPGVSWTTSNASLMATSIYGTSAAAGSAMYQNVVRGGYTTASAVTGGWIQVDLGALYPVDSIDLGLTDAGACGHGNAVGTGPGAGLHQAGHHPGRQGGLGKLWRQFGEARAC